MTTGAPGAREIAAVLEHPECDRIAAIVLSGCDPCGIADVLDIPYREKSPIALEAGRRFETRVLARDAELLCSALRQSGIAGPERIETVTFARHPAESWWAWRARRSLESSSQLLQRVRSDGREAILLIKPVVILELGGRTFHLEPDGLFSAAGQDRFEPVEIKTALDRGPLTSPTAVRRAATQAALADLAVRQMTEMPETSAREESPALLVLQRAGQAMPSLRRIDVRPEQELIRRTFSRPDRDVRWLEQMRSGRRMGPLPSAMDLIRVQNAFEPGCASTCPLALHCASSAIGSRAWLGDRAADGIGAHPTLDAACRDMTGPADHGQPTELQAGFHAFLGALCHGD